jgi:hypothetical protein
MVYVFLAEFENQINFKVDCCLLPTNELGVDSCSARWDRGIESFGAPNPTKE